MNELQKAILDVLIQLDEICKKHNIEYSLYGGTFLGAVRHKGFIPWDDDIDIVLDRENYEKLVEVLKDTNNYPEEYYFQSYETSYRYFSTTPKFRSRKVNAREMIPKTSFSDNGVWVDLFVWDNLPNENEERIKYFKKLKFIDNVLMTFIFAQPNPEASGPKETIKKTLMKINESIYKLYFFIPPLMNRRLKLMQKYNNIQTTHKAVNSYCFYTGFDEYLGNVIDINDMNKLVDYDFEGHKFPAYENYDKILTSFYGDYMKIPDEADRVIHRIER